MSTAKQQPVKNRRSRVRSKTPVKHVKAKLETKVKTQDIPAAFVSKSRRNRHPRVSSTGNVTRVTHSEYVTDVLSSETFSLNTMRINPGLPEFPWLQTVAHGWEHYRMINMRAIYTPVVGTTTAGLVGMAPDYHANEPDPLDFKSLMVAEGSTRAAAYSRNTCKIDRKAAHMLTPWKYVRHPGTFVSNAALYDICLFQYATDHSADTGVIVGEIYFEYTFEFKTAQIDRPIVPTGGVLSADRYSSQSVHNLDEPAALISYTNSRIDTITEDGSGGNNGRNVTLAPGTYQATAQIAVESECETDVGLPGDALYILDFVDSVTHAPITQTTGGAIVRNHVGDAEPTRTDNLILNQIFTLVNPTTLGVLLTASTAGGTFLQKNFNVLGRGLLQYRRLTDNRYTREMLV